MDGKNYIKKFIRDDGEVLTLDDNELYLDEDNNLLVRPDPDTSAVSYTEANGGEMINQKNPPSDQTVTGIIVPKTTPYWTLVTRLTTFFRINHTYKIIYVQKGGKMLSVSSAWISASLQIAHQPREDYARWDITFTLGDEAWREYSEDASGNETYANSVILPLISNATGGEIWDEIGEVWDEIGGVWEEGDGGPKDVAISSSEPIYPVWVVVGPCINPTLQNNTTDTVATYNGTVAEGQTLTVDFITGIAHLGTALVTRYVEGVVKCNSGMNTMGFSSDGGATDQSTIKWNNRIG